MNQTDRIIAGSKRHTKARDLSYAEPAQRRSPSLPTVKRVLSRRTRTLDRLEAIGVELSDLAARSRMRDRLSGVLSRAHEAALAKDALLVTVFHRLVSRRTVRDILHRHELHPTQCQQLPARPEALGLIELHPGNRVRRRVSRAMRWRHDGPPVARRGRRVMKAFVCDGHDGDRELLRVGERKISIPTCALLARKFARSTEEFDNLADLDALPPREERSPVGFLVARRPFRLSVFDALPKRASAKGAARPNAADV